jgi:hypothetical protein
MNLVRLITSWNGEIFSYGSVYLRSVSISIKMGRISSQVFNAPQAITERAPPTAPSPYIAVGILRTPVAKMTIAS